MACQRKLARAALDEAKRLDALAGVAAAELEDLTAAMDKWLRMARGLAANVIDTSAAAAGALTAML